MTDQIMKNLQEKTEKTLERLKEELASLRAGRANPAIVDKVLVNYYDTPTPLKQLANIAVTDPRTLTITPFDANIVKDVEKGVIEANIGITPSNDGKVIRLTMPQVTEERRKELTKTVKATGEEAKVAIRNLRRVANDEFKKAEKNGDITEDILKDGLDKVQKDIDKAVKTIDEIVAKKDKEILEI